MVLSEAGTYGIIQGGDIVITYLKRSQMKALHVIHFTLARYAWISSFLALKGECNLSDRHGTLLSTVTMEPFTK